NAKIDGRFNFSTVYKEINKLLFEYQLNLENDKVALETYYNSKHERPPDYQVNYVLNINDFEPIAKVFSPELYISPSTKVAGDLIGGYTSILNISTLIDSINYKNDHFLGNEMQLSISKISDSTSVLASLYATSENENISGIETKDLFLEAIWNNKHIDFELDIDQVTYPNYLRLLGEIDFLDNKTEIQFSPSDVHILDDKWSLRADNLISISGKEIKINNLSLYHEDQNIKLEGELSENKEKKLLLTLDSIDIGSINTILSKDLDGIVNGSTSMQDYYHDMRVTSDLTIYRFSVNEFLVGDITGKNTWNNQNKNFDVNFAIHRLDQKVLDLEGTYAPGNEGLNLT
ncbi:MAG: hypothetical protein AAFX57_20840, partial [Bacteroidota bacterium]